MGHVIAVCAIWICLFTSVSGVYTCEKVNLQTEDSQRESGTTLVYLVEKNCGFCESELVELEKLQRVLSQKSLHLNVLVAVDYDQPAPKTKFPVVEGSLWNFLEKSSGHIFLFDRCDRFTYEVILPWSLQIFPYTKASILSTMYDNPCGVCNEYPKKEVQKVFWEKKKEPITVFPEMTSENNPSQQEKTSEVPFKMVIPLSHRHEGADNKIYKFVVLDPKNPKFHGHLPRDGHLPIPDDRESTISTTSSQEVLRSTTVNYRTRAGREPALTLSPSTKDEVPEQPSIRRSRAHSAKAQSFFETTSPDESNRAEQNSLKRHYSNIVKWVGYNI